MQVLIIGNGTPSSKTLLQSLLTKKTLIIAADGGANCLWRYKIAPHYIIGDCDSLTSRVLKYWQKKNIPIERYAHDKDFTDTQLAFKKAQALGATKIIFLGCLGGIRVDHTLGVFGLLAECLRLKITAAIQDPYQIITLIDKPAIIRGKRGRFFSLQAFGRPINNLCITGSKYTLTNYKLHMGDPRTLSNEFCGTPVKITFKGPGVVLVLVERKE